jgi:RNA polymerase sigma-70 factor (ECF subfamily)
MPLAPSTNRVKKREQARFDIPSLAELYARSGAEAYGLSCDQFKDVLHRILSRTEDIASCADSEIANFLSGLRLEELAVAHGCAAGNQHAWDVFLTRYRESIYQSARVVTRNESTGRELADSLYAELYGLGEGEERRSKLALYSGRGSLAGWLRMVIAQNYVNHIRAGKRLVSIDEEEDEHGTQFAAPVPEPVVVSDPRVKQAVGAALVALEAEERYILSSYFLDQRKLAEIGRTLGVHESTISRKLEKILKELRKNVRKDLEKRGMSRRQAEEALQVDVRDVEFDVAAQLRDPAPRRR